MYKRDIETQIINSFTKYPICTIIGPRQSGKTTLAKACFPNLEYYNLEDPSIRDFAINDPKGFLNQTSKPIIIDEIQRVPEILSYLQILVDEKGKNGQYVITGSNQLALRNQVSQSLAGRTSIFTLLPFSIHELKQVSEFSDEELIFNGGYPRIFDNNINPTQAYGDYLDTYVERDLLQFISLKNLRYFRVFLRLCAGRVGQILNFNSISNDVGVSHTTIREWFSILENSFIAYSLQPYHINIRKRLIKSPKIYFYDTGLATFLLEIEQAKQLKSHPLRGNLFENLVINEIIKMRYNAGRRNTLSFYRDSSGNEIDCIYPVANKIIPIEIKSSSTITQDFFKGFTHISKIMPESIIENILLFSGTEEQNRSNCLITNYRNISNTLQNLEVL